MHDGSTPTPEPAPFAVGYGNGYGYESLTAVTPSPAAVAARGPVTPRWGEAAAAPVVAVDPDATVAMATPPAAVPATATPAPFVARPVGAAHPRRRFGRGLVLAGVALLVAGAGVGAVALGTAAEVHPASAAASTGVPAARSTATTVGDQLGRVVDPRGVPSADDPAPPVPASIIDPITTQVPPTVPTTAAPPVTAPPTTTPTVPPTTAPPTTTPPPTTPPPTGPTFATLNVPATVDCPSPDTQDATASFSWSAPGATEVTLSIDGPGAYRSYPGPTGTETVSFPCGSSHTYLFTAHGAGGTVVTRSFTVSPG